MKTKLNDFEQLWSQIESQTEWDQIYTCMKALDWQWLLGREMGIEVMGIPSIDYLKLTGRRLCKSAYEAKTTTSTGGFMASYIDEVLALTFHLTEATAEL